MHFFTTPKRVMRAVLALIACSITTLSVYAMPAPDYAAVTALPRCSSIGTPNATSLPSQLAWGAVLELSFSAPTQPVSSSDLLVYEVDANGAPIANNTTYSIPALTTPTGYGAFDTTGAELSQTTRFATLFVHKDAAGNSVCRSDLNVTQFQGINTDVLGVQVGATGTEICSVIGQTFATSVANPEFRTAGEAVEISFSNKNSPAQAGQLIVRDVHTNQQFTVPANVNASNGFTNIVSNGFPGAQNRTVEVFFEHTSSDGNAVVCRSNSKFINFSAPQTVNFSSAAPATSPGDQSEEVPPTVIVGNCKNVFYLDGSDAFVSIPAGATHISGNNITGSSCDDIIYGNGNDNVLDGLGGDDTIFGFDGDDTITGGNGDDYLYGGASPCLEDDDACVEESNTGNDTIHGDAGNDTIYGGNEECLETGDSACNDDHIGDSIEGGTGDDTIFGGDETCDDNGNNACKRAHIGDDIDGGDGFDVIEGGDESCNSNGNGSCEISQIGDDIAGGDDADSINGGDESCNDNGTSSCDNANTHIGDNINGGAGNDTIDAGNESCNDNGGRSCDEGAHIGDDIEGGAGNDTVNGGNEECTGNEGDGRNRSCDEGVKIGDIISDASPSDEDTIDAGGGNDSVDVADDDTNDTVTNAEDVTSDAGDTTDE